MFFFIVLGLAIVFILAGVAITLAGETLSGIATIVITTLLFIGITLLMSYHTVENGHIGIVKQFGSIVGTTGEGLVGIAPWKDLSQVSVRNELKTYTMDDRTEAGSGSAVSSDSQPVFLVVQVNYSLVRAGAVDLYRETGGHYVERILDPAVFQITKEVTAGYKAIDFAKNREAIRQKIQRQLQAEVGKVTTDNGETLDAITINNVSLKNVDFTDALSKAIEETVEAEQQAARERAKVEISEAQAKQAIAVAQGKAQANVTEARGEATANRLRARSLTAKNLQQLAIEKMNPNVQIIVCPPRTVCIPNSTTIPTP